MISSHVLNSISISNPGPRDPKSEALTTRLFKIEAKQPINLFPVLKWRKNGRLISFQFKTGHKNGRLVHFQFQIDAKTAE